jgi:mRNA-degrading endonuclease toxin of MazEF toxin-antitoxin module
VRRGEVWLADLPDRGAHPVVLISRDGSYERRRRATVAIVTSTQRGIPVEVPVGTESGLDHQSIVNVDDLFTLRLSQLIERRGALQSSQIASLDAALHFALGLRD